MLGQKSLTLEGLLGLLAHSQDKNTLKEAYDHSSTLLTSANLEQVLGSLLDPALFPQKRNEFIQGLKQAYECVQKDSTSRRHPSGQREEIKSLAGAIGLVCLILELLDIADQQSQDSPSIEFDWAQALLSPQALLGDPAVLKWFKEVYAPGPQLSVTSQNDFTEKQAEDNLRLAQKHWQELNLEDHLCFDKPYPLVLHRVGTTSFLLRCRIHTLVKEELVLKCLLFPYTRIPDIATATRNYALKYPGGTIPATVRVCSSTNKWILMDFIAGNTLQEFLQERRMSEETANTPLLLRTDLLSSIGKPLLEALNELTCNSIQHEDLIPSNIIVCTKPDKTIDRIVFIDLGRNYLYTHQLGLEARREAIFVAPEVKNGEDSNRADLYSFGMILIDLADPIGVQGSVIPDSLYQHVPYLARFIEDLIDKKPENRLLIFERKDLYSVFTNLLQVLPPEHEVKPTKYFWLQQFWVLFFPKDQFTRAWKLWRIMHPNFQWRKFWRILRPFPAQPAIAEYTSRLYGWLVVNTIGWWLIFLVSIIWGARDLGMNLFLPTSASIAQIVIPGCHGTCMPLIDALQGPGYHFGPGNLPARLVGFTAGLALATYYQNILAGLTTKPMNGRLARVTEFSLRFILIYNPVLVLAGNLYQPDWWLGLVIVGYPAVALTNILCYRLAIHMLDRAREQKLSSVPASNDPSLKNFGQWGITILSIIVLLIGLWVGLKTRFLHDTIGYAIIGSGINVFVLCISKAIILAPGVRGALCRAFTLGERLKKLSRRKNPANTHIP